MVAPRTERFAQQVVDQLAAEIPVYGALAPAELAEVATIDLRTVIDAIRTGRHPSPESPELVSVAALAERRAEEGIPVEALVRAYHVGAQVLWVGFGEAAGELGSPVADVARTAAALWEWVEAVQAVAIAAHRRAERALDRLRNDDRAILWQGLLSGALSSEDLDRLATRAGIDPAAKYLCIRARLPESADPVVVRRDLDRNGPAGSVFWVLDDDVIGLCSTTWGIAAHCVLAGVAGPVPLDRVGDALGEATEALEVAEHRKRRGIVRLIDVALDAMVHREDDLGRMLVERHLDALHGAGPMAGELPATLRTWFEHGCNVAEAAAALHLHPNTLRYRLSRYEVLAGIDLGSPTDLFELWWALRRQT